MSRGSIALIAVALLAALLPATAWSEPVTAAADPTDGCVSAADADLLLAQQPPSPEPPDVGASEPLPEPDSTTPGAPAPSPGGVALPLAAPGAVTLPQVGPGAVTGYPAVGMGMETALLTAFGSGSVIAGPGQHYSGCPIRRSTLFYTETVAKRMTITVQNLGDCRLAIYGAGRRIDLPGLRSGYTSGGLTVETDRFEYECTQGRVCRFLWVVRGTLP